jgi:hypothetical protein
VDLADSFGLWMTGVSQQVRGDAQKALGVSDSNLSHELKVLNLWTFGFEKLHRSKYPKPQAQSQ